MKKRKGTLPPANHVRLTINMPKGLHKRLAARAAKTGGTITAIIIAALAAWGMK